MASSIPAIFASPPAFSDNPALVASTTINLSVLPSEPAVPEIIPLKAVQRGTKCVSGLFIETGGDLYNLTCGYQAAGNRIFSGIYNNVKGCAKQCSLLRDKGTEECDAVIFNQKILAKRAPVNCYGLIGINGGDVKTLVDSAVYVPRIYTLVPGGIILGPALAQPSFLFTPLVEAPIKTFADLLSAGAATTTPNFYTPYPRSTTTTPPQVAGTSVSIPLWDPLTFQQAASLSLSPSPQLKNPANPSSSPPACKTIEYVTNGNFQNLTNSFPQPWTFFGDQTTGGSSSIQRIPSDGSDVSVRISASSQSTSYASAAVTQTLPDLCTGSNYTLSFSNQMLIYVPNTNSYCEVTFSLEDQQIAVIGGQAGDPIPTEYQNRSYVFQYGGGGTLGKNILVVTLGCVGQNAAADYTIDNISLLETRCADTCLRGTVNP